jgi:pimeloyl-ACP methyl ester carboxylesterase
MPRLKVRALTKYAVVLVHGMLHGAWCWERVIEGLAELDIEAVAVDLPGRGQNVDVSNTLAESVAVIREAIDSFDSGVVVCGHSMGGVPISHLDPEDDRIRHLVYLAANMPETKEQSALFQEQGIGQVGDRLIFDGTNVSVANKAAAVELFYHDCPADTAQWAFERLIADLAVDATDPGVYPQLPTPWKSVLSTYVVCANDQALLPQIQRQLARRAHMTREFQSGHSPFLSRPELVIELLAGIASGDIPAAG